MSLFDHITIGELREAIEHMPADMPVMLVAGAGSAGWLRRIRGDVGSWTIDLLAGPGALDRTDEGPHQRTVYAVDERKPEWIATGEEAVAARDARVAPADRVNPTEETR